MKTASKRARQVDIRLMPTSAQYASLCKKAVWRLGKGERSRVELDPRASLSRRPHGKARLATIVVSSVADLSSAERPRTTGADARHLLFLDELPIEAVAGRLPQLDIRSPHRLHLAARRSSKQIEDLLYRLVLGITTLNGPQPIVDAWIEQDQFVLLSPEFERLIVSLQKLARIVGDGADRLQEFEIDEDGRYVHWPHGDVHLGWEQFQQLVDPAAALSARERSAEFWARYGAAIRSLREESNIKQSDVPGVTDRNLRRVEHGELPASSATLRALADAHHLTLDAYMEKLASRLGDTRGVAK